MYLNHLKWDSTMFCGVTNRNECDQNL